MRTEQLLDQATAPAISEDYLDKIIDNTQAIRRESDRGRMKAQLSNFFDEVVSGSVVISSDLISSIEERIIAIDQLLSSQISLIMHAPEFQEKESSWRGLHKLVESSITENT
ncbi:hypothetical protein C3Z09_21925 [Lelliottia aquatilis]|nr:hypothetical protein C3Z09_21925 [Lelliottia aquatilis]